MKVFVIIAIIFLLTLNIPEKEINVAIYYSNINIFSQEIKDAIDYSWKENGIKYKINAQIIEKEDIEKGKLTSYDVLIIPGSGRPYLDALNEKWKEEVKKFVYNGGGYIGICGGANIASMGFENGINKILNKATLKIANVYLNDDQMQEWQYLWRSNWSHGGIPINLYIPRNDNPIFDGFYGSYRSMRYWGGAGMYEGKEKRNEIIPLAIFAEEPMEIAPLHRWIWLGKWIPYRVIKTDIKGQYAAIATTYGKGRVVLFSPHPEKETFFGGYVEEIPVHPKMTPFTWFMYNWIGNKSNLSYNWWILRRSIAWVANVKIPPASQTMVRIEEPRYGIYINGRKIIQIQNEIIIGKLHVYGKSINVDKIYLYIDGKLIDKSNEEIEITIYIPSGKHIIRLIGKNKIEETGNEINVFVI